MRFRRYAFPSLAICAAVWACSTSACSQPADQNGGTFIPGDTADPTKLPAATGQHPAAGNYGRALSAGQTYVDPNSNVTVLKLTDASTPEANGGMYHGYSEGGPTISQPWTGTDSETYYTAKVSNWLVDIKISTLTPSNWRQVNY
ncbi:MAG TPA: hypothetical protein VN803_11765, partial [Gemmatimonadales bacterium]|nr:hypothetical protein [Gemmatimonadales bacterium]